MTKQLLTPVGTLYYPHLERARDYKGDGKFKYDCKLELEGAEAAKMIEQCEELVKASAEEHKQTRTHPAPYQQVVDAEGNPIPGKFRFSFKVTAKIETKSGDTWDRKPKIFDAFGQPVKDRLGIGSGTKARISFTPYLWKNPSGAGVTLQPDAVQIVKLVQGRDGDSAQAYGFGQVEGGFAATGADDDANAPDGSDEQGQASATRPSEF